MQQKRIKSLVEPKKQCVTRVIFIPPEGLKRLLQEPHIGSEIYRAFKFVSVVKNLLFIKSEIVLQALS